MATGRQRKFCRACGGLLPMIVSPNPGAPTCAVCGGEIVATTQAFASERPVATLERKRWEDQLTANDRRFLRSLRIVAT